MPASTKTCNRCHQPRLLKEYFPDSGTCRSCLLKHDPRTYYRLYRRAHRECIARNRRSWDLQVRADAIAHYGNRCHCCRTKQSEFLEIEKVSDEKDGFVIGNLYYWLQRKGYPSGYRVTCFNCRFAVKVHGQCPHEQFRPRV